MYKLLTKEVWTTIHQISAPNQARQPTIRLHRRSRLYNKYMLLPWCEHVVAGVIRHDDALQRFTAGTLCAYLL